MDMGIVRLGVLLPRCHLGEEQPLQGVLVQITGERPAQALADRPLHVLAHRALGRTGRGGDPLVTEFRLELEAQNLFDLAHGTPFGWHRHSREKSGSLASELRVQRRSGGSIPGEPDRAFRIVTDDSGRSRKSVTFERNERSRSARTAGHVQAESVVTMLRNTQQRGSIRPVARFPRLVERRLGVRREYWS